MQINYLLLQRYNIQLLELEAYYEYYKVDTSNRKHQIYVENLMNNIKYHNFSSFFPSPSFFLSFSSNLIDLLIKSVIINIHII